MLTEILRKHLSQNPQIPYELKKISEYLEMHLNEKTKIKTLCHYAYTNKNKLQKYCKYYMNSTINSYLAFMRLKKVIALFNNEKTTTARVAVAVGIQPNNFSRFIRRTTGMSVKEFKEAIKAEYPLNTTKKAFQLPKTQSQFTPGR